MSPSTSIPARHTNYNERAVLRVCVRLLQKGPGDPAERSDGTGVAARFIAPGVGANVS